MKRLLVFIFFIIVVLIIYLRHDSNGEQDISITLNEVIEDKEENTNNNLVLKKNIDIDTKKNLTQKHEEDEVKDTFLFNIKMYEQEFEEERFKNLEKYHHIIILCNSVPKTSEEYQEWLIKHGSDEGVDIKHMKSTVKNCEDVEKQSYKSLELLYRNAIDRGEESAKLVLAKLMPFMSEEKINFLSDSAIFDNESVDILANISLEEVDYLTLEQRFFWVSISPLKNVESYKVDNFINDLHGEIDNGILALLNELIDKWATASEEEKSILIKRLYAIEST